MECRSSKPCDNENISEIYVERCNDFQISANGRFFQLFLTVGNELSYITLGPFIPHVYYAKRNERKVIYSYCNVRTSPMFHSWWAQFCSWIKILKLVIKSCEFNSTQKCATCTRVSHALDHGWFIAFLWCLFCLYCVVHGDVTHNQKT